MRAFSIVNIRSDLGNDSDNVLTGDFTGDFRSEEPRFARAMLRQAKRVPNDKGSSLSTVGELNPRESKEGNSSRSIL